MRSSLKDFCAPMLVASTLGGCATTSNHLPIESKDPCGRDAVSACHLMQVDKNIPFETRSGVAGQIKQVYLYDTATGRDVTFVCHFGEAAGKDGSSERLQAIEVFEIGGRPYSHPGVVQDAYADNQTAGIGPDGSPYGPINNIPDGVVDSATLSVSLDVKRPFADTPVAGPTSNVLAGRAQGRYGVIATVLRNWLAKYGSKGFTKKR